MEANDPWVTCEQLMPVLPIVMLAMTTALRVDTDALLPTWYRRMFGAPV